MKHDAGPSAVRDGGVHWSAQWISPAETAEHAAGPDRGAFVLSRTFSLTEAPLKARLSATALGVYEAFINGSRVGDIELAPGSTSYDSTLYFQQYDVAHLLVERENTIEIVLSDGWYRGRNSGAQRRDVWGDTTAVLAQLDIVRSDDSAFFIGTDSEWFSRPSAIVRADLMTGQTTDFTAASGAPGPAAARVGVVSPPTPTMSPAPPVRRVEERPPLSLNLLRPGVSVLDTGQNLSGWLRLTELGPAGHETVLEFGEHLDAGGDLSTTHLDLRTPAGQRLEFQQIDRVISDGTSRDFEPRHTVHGFQYVRISHPGRELSIDELTVIVVHSDVERRGWFHCSSNELERLHEAALWSFRGNIVDVPTDCPTRERSGWTGDYQVFAPVATMLYDVESFSRKWLQSVRDDQDPFGLPAAFSPDSLRIRHNLDNSMRILGGAAGWGDAVVLVPWTIYAAYGDDTVLTENYGAMRAWVEYALGLARTVRHADRVARSEKPRIHEQFIWDGPFHYGEWLEPKQQRADGTFIDPMAENPHAYMSRDRGEVGTGYLYVSVQTLAQTAAVLGQTVDSEKYTRLADQIREAWQIEFLRADGRTADDSQGAYVRALAFGLIPDELRSAAASRLVGLIDENDNRLSTGFLSSGLLLGVLADHGHTEVAYRLLLRHGTPSWLGMLDRGATTVWEDWDGIDERGRAHESLNHYSKGAVIGFLHEHVVGLRQSQGSAGWDRFEVRPVLGGDLTSAGSRYQSPHGEIVVDWRLQDQEFTLTVVIPPGSQATIVLPDGQRSAHSAGTVRLAAFVFG